ncbi:SubName: Full=Uncharacterized protein {ECO:0000313/EMBL:CCA69502.1} [Serendipita indica DSM 11827]|nr:SubName: Full=Uncharacterized protein {ECO:0000313/EMBL:CCA69502.1} [Serendipita indica DSM 11827]
MAHFTPIPSRTRAEMRQIVTIQDENEVSVAELLQQLRARFDEDDIQARILHYPDSTIDEYYVEEEAEDVAMEPVVPKNNPPRRIPPTPARPDHDTLAKLLEVSSDDDSNDESYEDTTADSQLAEWLASFTNATKSDQLKRLHMYPKTPPKLLQDDIPSAFDPTDKAQKTTPLPHYQVGRPGHTPWMKRRVDFRHRAVSDPCTSSSEPSVPHRRSISAQVGRTVEHGPKFTISKDNETNSSLTTRNLQPPFFPPFDFELEPTVSPQATSNLYEAILSPITPRTPSLATPIDSQNSFADEWSSPLKMQPQDAPGYHVRFSQLAHFNSPTKGLDLSIANSLADISNIHAYNAALKHASKSPAMIRRWQHMLNELAERFPLTSHIPDLSQLLLEDNEMHKSPISSSTPIAARTDATSYESLSDEQQPSFEDQRFNLTEVLTARKTLADTILDREYASYLRKSIEFKRDEVRVLGELMRQRQKTIERLEEILKRRAMDILSS